MYHDSKINLEEKKCKKVGSISCEQKQKILYDCPNLATVLSEDKKSMFFLLDKFLIELSSEKVNKYSLEDLPNFKEKLNKIHHSIICSIDNYIIITCNFMSKNPKKQSLIIILDKNNWSFVEHFYERYIYAIPILKDDFIYFVDISNSLIKMNKQNGKNEIVHMPVQTANYQHQYTDKPTNISNKEKDIMLYGGTLSSIFAVDFNNKTVKTIKLESSKYTHINNKILHKNGRIFVNTDGFTYAFDENFKELAKFSAGSFYNLQFFNNDLLLTSKNKIYLLDQDLKIKAIMEGPAEFLPPVYNEKLETEEIIAINSLGTIYKINWKNLSYKEGQSYIKPLLHMNPAMLKNTNSLIVIDSGFIVSLDIKD